jgi:hypothetical protein
MDVRLYRFLDFEAGERRGSTRFIVWLYLVEQMSHCIALLLSKVKGFWISSVSMEELGSEIHCNMLYLSQYFSLSPAVLDAFAFV